ncbi:cytochrome P450 [Streptomyces sp. NPDC087263]|uniref:cytochrome P450 n=1 Tax=Streptomyces sp. NPDC087263 TaxID=3365773 RepID=UPI0037FC9241
MPPAFTTGTAPPAFTTGTAPAALPLVGHAWALLRHPLEFLAAQPRHGDLVHVRLGPLRALLPTHPDLLWRVLTDDRTFDKGGHLFERGRTIVGDGLITCPHDAHRRQRRLIQPAFHHLRMPYYATIMEEEIATLTQPWHNGLVINAFPTLSSLAMRTVSRTMFGIPLHHSSLPETQAHAQTVISALLRRTLVPQTLQRLPLPANRRYRQALHHLHSIRDHLATDSDRSGDDHTDLLSTLLTAQKDPGNRVTDTEIGDQVMTMFVAGSETVAATLSWALHLLTEHPDIQAQLHHEVDTVLAGRPARFSDLPQLPYTERVITETLRLYPPAWLLTRVTTAPTELAGHPLSPGSTILLCPPAVHRHPDFYPAPLTFDPDRWLPEKAAALPRGAYVAFIGGPRKCIGDTYAMNQSTLALATIAARWKPEQAPGTDPRPATLSISLRPRRLLLRLRPRP